MANCNMAMSPIAATFAHHVEVDDGVLATSAPLELQSLDKIILLVADGLQKNPEMSRVARQYHEQLVIQRVIHIVDAVSGMLMLLQNHSEAQAFFKESIVKVLTGQGLPLQPPSFSAGTKPTSPSSPAPVQTNETIEAPVATSPASVQPPAPLVDNKPQTSSDNKPPTSSVSTPLKRSLKEKSPEKATKETEINPKRIKKTTEPDAVRHPIYTIPTHWEELYYKPVQTINIQSPGSTELIQSLRFSGTPFILEGYDANWMEFASSWVTSDKRLNTEAFLHGLHDVKVPVIEKNYQETNPIKTHIPLGTYVKQYWEQNKSDYYMHQWQFPLSPKAAKILCYKCQELPVLGDNLLLYWLDAVRGDNPLQYLFMGQTHTTSRMHQDPGGLDIMIAPIVGTKRVTMLHRSAAKVDSIHETVNFHQVDLNKCPLLAFLPAWRVDLSPQQILYMPEGTFHACENTSPCLSYHRFHVDTVNIPGFLTSFMAQDSPSINHAEILWNAAHDVMAALEENYHANGKAIDTTLCQLRKLDSLRALRHVARILSLEETLPTEDAWDWNKLLEDIDHLLIRIDTKAIQHLKRREPVPTSTTPKEIVDLTTSSPSTTHWDTLALKVGDIIGVQVFEKRNKATVLKIALNMELVQVHYVEWGSIYDEFLPLSSLYQRTRHHKKVPLKKLPKVHETILAKWGSNEQLYNAIVLKVLCTNACYVHYLKYENDWNQWILPGHIFKKYS